VDTNLVGNQSQNCQRYRLDILSLTSKVRTSTFWILAVRGFCLTLSFVSLPVLARLLNPEDYGLMGIVSVVMMILEVFSRTGFENALIRRPGEIDGYLNSVWTAALARGVLQGLILLVLANPLARFYERDQLTMLLAVIAIVPVLQGTRSVGITVLLFRRMDFRRIAFYQTISMFVQTLATISSAFLLKNVWALVIGNVIGKLAETMISYYVAPSRPRFKVEWDKWRELWAFGRWEWFSAIMFTLFHNGDDLLIGKILGTQALGHYRMSYRIANMATTEGVNAVRKVLFPAFAHIQDDVTRLRNTFIDFWRMTAILGLGFSAILYVVASPLVSVFLGSKWGLMVPALRVLAIWGGLQVLKTGTSPIFRSINRPDWWAKSLAVRAIVMASLIYPLSTRWELVGAATAVLLASLVDLPITAIWVSKSIDCRFSDLVKPLILPAVGVVVVIVSVISLEHLILPEVDDLARLLAIGVIASGSFGSTILVGDAIFRIGIRTKVLRLVKG